MYGLVSSFVIASLLNATLLLEPRYRYDTIFTIRDLSGRIVQKTSN